TATLTGSVALTAPATSGSAGTPASLTASSLMLSGDHALVLANSLVASPAGPAVAEPKTDLALEASGPALVLVDLSDRPTVLGTYEMEGRIVDARQVGTTARVVVTSTPSVKASAIDDSTVEDWLPEYSVTEDGHRTTNRVACESVRHPAAYSGSSLLSVLTFDLAAKKLGTGDPVTIVADGQTVYSTANNLYVATTNQWNLASKTETVETTVYQFDIAGSKKPEYIAAGCVPGVLLNQYSMSEWNGHLRLATTQQAKIVVNDPATGEEATPGRRARITAPADTATVRPSESSVSVLRRDGGKLVVAGKVGGLGKGERIYSVRFAQDAGYVVTFRQTDPLYTVDLRDPKNPRVLGELELTGYSAYLHPLDGNLLIGVGQEATTQGRLQGTLVSLFDVSDLSTPKRLAKYEVRLGSSEAEFDPHAFLYWAKTSTLVIPVSKAGRSAAVVLSISGTLITERGTIEHSEHTAVRRAIVIGETLWTVSASGAMAHDLAALTTEASIAW
ncbi:MAG: beta-propeller domain-containing protein, partial [Micromonosporaceae bacterium]|nr:beta-propeller domain-containing protein [Micromonosporaceae bacterium]